MYRIASSTELTVRIGSTGPNISSCMTLERGSASTTVGEMYRAGMSTSPPVTIVMELWTTQHDNTAERRGATDHSLVREKENDSECARERGVCVRER
jgi:hypothetical protein